MEIIQSCGVSYIAQQLQRDRESLSSAQASISGDLPGRVAVQPEEICHIPIDPIL